MKNYFLNLVSNKITLRKLKLKLYMMNLDLVTYLDKLLKIHFI